MTRGPIWGHRNRTKKSQNLKSSSEVTYLMYKLCKLGNKCVKILKFWRTELSYAQNKNRGKRIRLLGMNTYPSLNDIMEIRCNKCIRSEQGYDV
jgi:hypothetical protein